MHYGILQEADEVLLREKHIVMYTTIGVLGNIDVDNSLAEKAPSINHGNDDNGVIKPRSRMSFKTKHELLDFYKQYEK